MFYHKLFFLPTEGSGLKTAKNISHKFYAAEYTVSINN